MESAESHDVYDATSRLVSLGWDEKLSSCEGIYRHSVHAVPSLSGFWLEGLLTKSMCKDLIAAFERVPGGFSKNSDVSVEYPAEYRNNLRMLTKLPVFTDSLWGAIQTRMQDSEVVGMKPYGWSSEGWWLPVGINDMWAVSKYESGQYFKPHYDGMYKDEAGNTMSILTITLYLNEAFDGGELIFYSGSLSDPVESWRWQPRAGSCFVMNHDILHAGDTVLNGVKYIMRSSIMYSRTSDLSIWPGPGPQPTHYRSASPWGRVRALTANFAALRAAGDPQRFTNAYLEAQQLQLTYGGSTRADMGSVTYFPFDRNVLAQICRFLDAKDVCALVALCKSSYYQFRRGFIWKSLFERHFSNSRFHKALQQNTELFDWFGAFRIRWSVEMGIAPLCVMINENVYGSWRNLVISPFAARATSECDPWDGSFSSYAVGRGELDWRTFGQRDLEIQEGVELIERIQTATQYIFPALVQRVEVEMRRLGSYVYGLHPLVLAINPALWMWRGGDANPSQSDALLTPYARADLWSYLTDAFFHGSYNELRMGSFPAISLIEEGAAVLLSKGHRTGFVISVCHSPIMDFRDDILAGPKLMVYFYRNLKPVVELDLSLPLGDETCGKLALQHVLDSNVYQSGDCDAVVVIWDEAGEQEDFDAIVEDFRAVFDANLLIEATPEMVLDGCRIFPSTGHPWEDSFVMRTCFLPERELVIRDLKDTLRQAQRDGNALLEIQLRKKLSALTLEGLQSNLWQRKDGELRKNESTEQ